MVKCKKLFFDIAVARRFSRDFWGKGSINLCASTFKNLKFFERNKSLLNRVSSPNLAVLHDFDQFLLVWTTYLEFFAWILKS